MENQLRILIVEDSENDAKLLLRQLEKEGKKLVWARVESAAEMTAALDRQSWDVVISDYVMPQFSGLDALKIFREKQYDIPFIVVSGQIGEDDAVAAMKAGADDYIMKTSLRKVGPALERELREAENRRARKKAEADQLAEHEDRLHAYERLAQLGRLAGGLAHELRNPLATISSSVFYLEHTLKSADEKTITHLQRMKSAVVVCESTIRNLLEEARTREPNLVREDLRAVLNRIIAECAVPETVVVTCGFPPVEVIVGVDVALLSMACRNIVKNAVEAMNGVGTITVKMDTDARSVVVSFRDSGPGIAKEHLDRIFQPLFTTKATGVGFGLSVAAMVIGKHGGTIKAESGNGSGAIFIMQLPLWEKSKVSRRESVA